MTKDFSRRWFIKTTFAASAASLLSACGPDSSAQTAARRSKRTPAPDTTSATPTPTPTPVPTATPTPTPASSLSSADVMNKNTYDGVLFNASSPWNQPISSAARADLNSANMIQNLALGFTSNQPFVVALDTTNYAVPIYYADANTPKVRVRDSTGWWDESAFTAVPMPPEARPDPGSDRHLVVWDVPNAILYEYWDMVKNADGTWSSGLGAKFSSNGSGYQTGIWQGSARAYGGSLAAGAIRYHEMKNGVIPHALAMSYQFTRGNYYARGTGADGTIAIGSHCDDVQDSNRINSFNIPEGARLRLKPSVDIAARAAAKSSAASQRACRIIGQALQTYGAYVVDHGGNPTIYAENLQGKGVSWAGLLDTLDTRPFLASDFEVLSLPSLTSSNLR